MSCYSDSEREVKKINQVVLVGRLTSDPELTKTENGKNKTSITIAVNRPFKNSDGIYETDFIRCTLWNGIATNATEYCKKGDTIGLKGRIQVSTYEDEEGNKKYSTDVIAERVSFLTSNRKGDIETPTELTDETVEEGN